MPSHAAPLKRDPGAVRRPLPYHADADELGGPEEAVYEEMLADVNAVYLRQLAALAVDLGAQATGPCDPGVIRLLRQRLTQWIEDLRSGGGNGDLASAVEELVKRLSDALAAPAGLSAEAAAISEELAKLATGARPPPEKKKSRSDFWK